MATLPGKMKAHCDNQSLPSDLIPDIFINLPVKSLVRFSCLSKSSLCYVQSPEFAMRHFLTTSTSSPCIVDYVPTMNSSKQVTLKMNIFSLTKAKTFHLEAKFEVGNATTVLVSNYCQGVTCMYLSDNFRGKKMVLFNPAIREIVEVPLSNNISRYGLTRFGIGFDYKSNDYKIMAVTEVKSLPGLEVYSVRNGTWRNISCEKYLIWKNLGPVLNAKGRILNLLGYRDVEFGVLSFDVVDEIFWLTHMPKCSCPGRYDHRLLPSSYWQVVLCCSSPGLRANGVIDIWVLDERIKVSNDHHEAIWSKHASIVIPIERYLVSPVELWMNEVEVFLQFKKKAESKVNFTEIFVYNLANKELKLIQELKPIGEGSFYIADVYMESLVSIKRLISSPEEEALAKQCGEKTKGRKRYETALEEESDDQGPLCFIREVLGENHVGWSYKFKLE